MSEPMTEQQTDIKKSTPRFDTERLELRDGWSGRVLTRCQGVEVKTTAGANLPTIAQWRPLLSQLVSDPSAMPGYTILKYSKEGEVLRARLVVGDRSLDVICKQSRPRGLRRRLVTALRASRERRNFDRALNLLRIGINTALPLALVEHGRRSRRAWLVTEFVPDLVDLDQMVLRLLPRLEMHRVRPVKIAITGAIVDLLVTLEQGNFSHRDLKASNLMLTDWDAAADRVSVWLVDLDGLRRLRLLGILRRWQPLIRLAASLLDYTTLTRADYARFLLTYLLRKGLPRETWKRRFRELARRANDYARRARGRKSYKLDGYVGDA